MFDRTPARHVAVALFAALLMVACGGASSDGPDSATLDLQAIKDVATGSVADELCFTLFAGQTIDAGDVCVSADCDTGTLTVEFTTTGGWELEEAHLWVGTNIADMPQTRKGNPKIGNFPYASGDITGATTHTFTVDFADVGAGVDCGVLASGDPDCTNGGDIILMAAHAALRKDNGDGTYQTETGWSNGGPITTKGSWATLSTFQLWPDDCTGDPGGGTGNCETAFAYHGTGDGECFSDIDSDGNGTPDGFERWGWNIGALGDGSYTYDIYAGAGQCDLDKGTLVGTLEVDYDATTGTLTVTFLMESGFTMEETHLYAGSAILPTKNGEFTVAPGQYGNIHEELGGASSDSYTITGLSGDIYIVAHAVVCDS